MSFIHFIRCTVAVYAVFSAAAVFAESVPRQQSDSAAEPFTAFLRYAEFAAAAYGDVDGFKRVCESHNFEFTNTGANISDKVRYFIATNDRNKSHIVAVRGTANMENALLDIEFELTPDKVLGIELHKGFADSSQNLYGELASQLHKNYTVHLTGHSLGGAVAVVLGMYLDKHGYSVGDIVTFGQPKVTNRSGAKTFEHLHILRVNTVADMVPMVPPFDASQIMSFKFDIFWHLGKEYVLLSDKYYALLDGLDSLLRGADFLSQKPTADNIAAHQMETYLKLIKNLAKSATEIPYDKRDEYIPQAPATTQIQKTNY